MSKLRISAGLIALSFLLVALTLDLIVTTNSDSAVYEDDSKRPLAERHLVASLVRGSRASVLRCIDDKSDQYIEILTPDNNHGYIYNLDVTATLSLSRSPKIARKALPACLLFLLDKISLTPP